MSSVDAIGISYIAPATSRALVPVQQSPSAKDSASKPPPPPQIVPPANHRQNLEARAELLQQRLFSDNGNSQRSQQALRAYRSLEEGEERDAVSRILGVDEYA